MLSFGYYEFGLFADYNAFKAQRDIKNGNIRILIYGELGTNEVLENKIAHEFGFRFDRVDDCTVNHVLINGVEQYNKRVKEYLRKTHGIDWETKFQERFKILEHGKN